MLLHDQVSYNSYKMHHDTRKNKAISRTHKLKINMNTQKKNIIIINSKKPKPYASMDQFYT